MMTSTMLVVIAAGGAGGTGVVVFIDSGCTIH